MAQIFVDRNGVSCFVDRNNGTEFVDQNGNLLSCSGTISQPYVSFRFGFLLVLSAAQIMARIGAGYG